MKVRHHPSRERDSIIFDRIDSEKVETMHIAEAIGYRCSALCDAFIVERRKNLDRGDWAERGI